MSRGLGDVYKRQPQIEAKLNPELDKLKTDLTDTIMSDPSEAAKILISYIKD